MPFPLPNYFSQMQGMMTQVLNLSPAQGKPPGMKDVDTQLDERDKKQKVEGSHRIRADLRGNHIETECPCKHDDQERCDANGRVYPDHHPQCQAPRKTARRSPTA